MTTKSKFLVVLALIASACGITMLIIGPPNTLDVRLFYSNEDAYLWLNSLTINQRSNYLITEYLDIGYTISYSMIFFFILGPIGLIPGILDLIETVPIILHLKNGSALPEHLGFVSGIKWITGVIVFVTVLWKSKNFLRKNTK